MKNITKTFMTMASIFGVVSVLGGCSQLCKHDRKDCVKSVNAKYDNRPYKHEVKHHAMAAPMYTRSSQGGQSSMGHIKFTDAENGVKMRTDLKDLRPGVLYTVKIHQCMPCASNQNQCCGYSVMEDVNLPNLRIANAGRLQETFFISGVEPWQLRNAKIVLERDGGYDAAWGQVSKNIM